MRKVHERFATWVDSTKLSQEKIAEQLGISQVAVSKIYRGETVSPHPRILLALETASATWEHGPILMREWAEADLPTESPAATPNSADSGTHPAVDPDEKLGASGIAS